PAATGREGADGQPRLLPAPERKLAAGRVADEHGAAVVLEREPRKVRQCMLEVVARRRPAATGDTDAAVLEVPARDAGVDEGDAEMAGVDQVVRRLPVAAVKHN